MAGQIQADGRGAAIAALRTEGYFPIDVDQQAIAAKLLRSEATLWGGIRTRDKALFTHQLAALLKAGMQLRVALQTLAEQTANQRLAEIIKQLGCDIEQSSALSEAMAKHPRVFSSVYRAMVKAAEQTGDLPETLALLSQQLKTQDNVRNRIRGALVYPVFLLLTSVTVVGVLTTFVIPKFVLLFVNTRQALPWPTRLLLGVTAFAQQAWWVLLLAFGLVVVATVVALRDLRLRRALHKLLMELPILGQLNCKLQLARWARTLGSLLKGGVQIVTALETTQGTLTNQAFSRSSVDVAEQILKGATLTEAVGKQPYFTKIALNMVATGENTGTLPHMLIELADLYDQDCEANIHAVTTLLGPVLIVVLGGIVGFVVMAILLPVFETGAMIH